jgi:phosphohistidine phosphatase SixA
MAAAREPLMIVGHVPHLGLLTSVLILGGPKSDLIQLGSGALVCLVRTQESFRLEWLLTPQLAGALELSTGSGGDG